MNVPELLTKVPINFSFVGEAWEARCQQQQADLVVRDALILQQHQQIIDLVEERDALRTLLLENMEPPEAQPEPPPPPPSEPSEPVAGKD